MTALTPAGQLLAEPADAVLLDVRWALGSNSGHDDYCAGHLPGAVFVDLETELAAPAAAAEGRHPLPSLPALQSAARRWGLKDGSRVVVYDDTGGLAAARAWWLLRWGGLADVTILDGGLAAWTAAGGQLEIGEVDPTPGDVTLTGGGMPVLTAMRRPRWPRVTACCSTPAPVSDTAARWSRSTRAPGTCPGRSARQPR